MSKRYRLLMPVLAILLIVISIRSASPPAVNQGVIPDTAFSVQRAFAHLLKISGLPHFTGTPENAKVRAYIAENCRQLGFSTEIQNTTSVYGRNDRVSAGNVYNIIAKKSGLHNSKSVVLMAHYDSQLNTAGAGDDGSGVAAILETARAIQRSGPLKNDLILLFTDAEETGMLGANAFVNDSPLINGIGLVINFEGRGNAGPSSMFEVNDDNGWAISGYARSAAHPFANSLGYEVYKKLPNYTDYTLFKKAGITGLNNAYIDGFVNYHSPNDKPANMDLRSLLHHGENMLGMAKYFGNLDITRTKAPDSSYFNVVGGWFVHYPAAWNLIFVLVTDLLFVFFLVAGMRNKKIKPVGFITGTVLFLLVLAIIYFSAKWLLHFILSAYPMYAHFDENNAYNSSWYFLSISLLAVTLFSAVYCLVANKINLDSLLAGILFVVCILVNGMQYAMPSGSYLLFFPLLFILFARLLVYRKRSNEEQDMRLGLWNLIGAAPAIFFLAPVIYFTFIAFAMGSDMPFAVVAVGLLTGLLLPVLYPALKRLKFMIPLAAFVCFCAAMSVAHFNAGFSEKHPLPSSLRYLMDTDSSKAKWLTDFTATDQWTAGFFKGGHKNDPRSGYSGLLINDAPVLPLSPPSAVLEKDTLENGRRKLSLFISASRENAFMMNIALTDSSEVSAVFINGKEAKPIEDGKQGLYRNISFTGLTGKGFEIVFETNAGKRLGLVLTDRSAGLPAFPGFDVNCPKDIIPEQGAGSHTIQVRKHFVF